MVGWFQNSSLIADAAGNLFGTTYEGGADNRGTVFEIAKTKGGYASAPITLVSFTGADGEFPEGSLIADAAGNLFGTTDQGGADNLGTVFEIAKTKSGYASAPTTLVSFTGADGTTGSDGSQPVGGLITDAAGDLFGTTTAYFHDGFGTVFEVAKTQDGYASKPTTLATFNGPDGAEPGGRLIADSQGDLFGTTENGGADNLGTVFEIARTRGGYAITPTTLVSFTGADGAAPDGGLIADAAGDLFGTTYGGGPDDLGTVFEIAKTEGGYASAPTTLASFDGANGENPAASLIADAAGNLFSTTLAGGAGNWGTVFKLAKTRGGYATAPTTLVSFTGYDGFFPDGSLMADAAGHLFGTTTSELDGPGDSTVFEITHSGFIPPTAPVAHAGMVLTPPAPPAAAFVQAMASHGAGMPGEAKPSFLASRHEISASLCRPQVA